MLTTILAFLIALGILITFHELGHYWAARRCGVRVLRFSVGFGKAIWTRTDRHGTQWAVAAIPLGGYVKMLDDAGPEHEVGQSSRRAEAFNQQPVWNRFFIVAAGPVANFVLATLIYAALNVVGTQEPQAILAQPVAGTPAAHAGILENDRLVSVNGQAVQSWPQARWLLMNPSISGGSVMLGVESAGRFTERQMTLAGIDGQSGARDEDPLLASGLQLIPGQVRLGEVRTDSAAERAGLTSGDVVTSIGGIENPDVLTFIRHIESRPDEPVVIGLRRGQTDLLIRATPARVQSADGKEVGRLGVAVSAIVPMVTIEQGVIESLWGGAVRTAETAWFSLRMLGKMIIGEISLNNLSGPVTIADYAGQTARVGLVSYLGFIALVSVSIGVLNLLPIPMLDGGHLAFYTLEIIRGKPAPARWFELGQRAGVAVLAGLMSLAIFNDLARLLS